MEGLKTIALIYEAGKDKVYQSVQNKLMFEDNCFTFIRVEPKMESSYTLNDNEMAKSLYKKLNAADEIYIINPKGTIDYYTHHFREYAKECGKPIRYMYKFCYKDCKFYKKNACTHANESYFIPAFHNLLPACESYSRIYDDLLVVDKEPKSASIPAAETPSPVATPDIDTKETADDGEASKVS